MNKDYLKGYLTDTGAIVTSPLRWTKGDWMVASLVVGAAAGLYAYDQDIKEWAQKRKGETTDRLSSLVKPFGDGFYTVPALGLFYLYGYAREDAKAERTSLLSLESFVIAGAFNSVLKYATHRARPEDTERYDKWDGPSFSSDHRSFASGHAAVAFSIATVIASEYDNAYVPPIAYGIATLTALARINDNAHWASDVLVGSAIGYFTAKAVIRLHKKSPQWSVSPTAVGQGQGLALSYRF